MGGKSFKRNSYVNRGLVISRHNLGIEAIVINTKCRDGLKTEGLFMTVFQIGTHDEERRSNVPKAWNKAFHVKLPNQLSPHWG